jgi:transglutaminase-like putative cysteine protease
MRLTVRYVTRFRYSSPVWESHNALRACPAEDGRQRLQAYTVEVSPAAPLFTYRDRWGTRVDTFGILEPHDELMVAAEARVETGPVAPPGEAPLSALDDGYRESHWIYLQPTRHARFDAALAGAAREAVSGSEGVVEAVRAVERRVHDTIEYRPGATAIGDDVASIWASGAGVCQDFAHVTAAMLRSVGIAARYVSGYFYAADSADGSAPPDGEIVVATHAWVEAAVPGEGWWPIDPTNRSPVGERHVKIGHGRDYDDVTPLRGVYYGETDHSLAAAVAMAPGPVVRRILPDVAAPAAQAQQ